MKITILGTANAWGPNLFLTPPAQWPMKGRLSSGTEVEIRKYRTSLLIETEDGKKILIDCCPDFSHQLRDFSIGMLDAIFLTHPHIDHIGGLDELNLYKPTGSTPIPTYATKACWNCIKNERGLSYIVDPLKLVSENNLLTDRNNLSISIGSVKITPFSVEHHFIAPGSVGFVFEETADGQTKRILYTGDLWTVSNPVDPLFKNQYDLIIMECDRWSGLAGPAVGGGHMSFEEAIRMLVSGVFSNPRPKQVIFVHFGDNGPNTTGSTYQDWRDGILDGFAKNGLLSIVPNEDIVIGYEGLKFTT